MDAAQPENNISSVALPFYIALLCNIKLCLSDLQEELNLLGVDKISSEIASVSKGLGFNTADFERNTDEFSGGWRMRIELVKILLKKPMHKNKKKK